MVSFSFQDLVKWCGRQWHAMIRDLLNLNVSIKVWILQYIGDEGKRKFWCRKEGFNWVYCSGFVMKGFHHFGQYECPGQVFFVLRFLCFCPIVLIYIWLMFLIFFSCFRLMVVMWGSLNCRHFNPVLGCDGVSECDMGKKISYRRRYFIYPNQWGTWEDAMQTVFLLLGCCSDTATDSGDAAKYNLTWFAHKKVEHMKGSAGETLDSTK